MLLRVTSLGQGLNFFFPAGHFTMWFSVTAIWADKIPSREAMCSPGVLVCGARVRRGIPGHAQSVSPAMLRGRV